MKIQLINRAFAAASATVVLGMTGSAFAANPADIASQAYRGQLPGIHGYNQFVIDVSSGRITSADVIKAAGETPTPTLECEVATFLNDYVRLSN